MSYRNLYAGVGPNREPAMIEAITGERPSLVNTVLVLDTALWVQGMYQAPDEAVADGVPSPRKILAGNWNEDDTSYGLREEVGSLVIANLFDLSDQALEHIRDWELVDLGWKEQRQVKVRVRTRQGGEVRAVTEFLPSEQDTIRRVNGLVHATYLNDPEKMHLLAKAARQEYLRTHPSL